jgi:hypothetical protein
MEKHLRLTAPTVVLRDDFKFQSAGTEGLRTETGGELGLRGQ